MSPLRSLDSAMLQLPRRAAGVGSLLGTLLLISTAPASLAAPLEDPFPQNPSSTTTDSGDVIIDPQPGGSGSSTPGNSGSSPLAGTRFSCQTMNGQYTVMYQPASQPGQSYPWAVPSAMGGGWNSPRRCSEISRRLEAYRPDGLLEMQTAMENGYNTICVTTQRVAGCRLVLTVPQGQDPTATRDRVFQNLTIADSGQQTQGVNTFVNGRSRSNGQPRPSGISGIIGEAARWLNINIPGVGQAPANSSTGINLQPFLDRKDGGTGTYLTKGYSNRPGRRLNPGNFR